MIVTVAPNIQQQQGQDRSISIRRRGRNAPHRGHFFLVDRLDSALVAFYVPGITSSNSQVHIDGRILRVQCRNHMGVFRMDQNIYIPDIQVSVVNGFLVVKAPKIPFRNSRRRNSSVSSTVTPSHVIPTSG